MKNWMKVSHKLVNNEWIWLIWNANMKNKYDMQLNLTLSKLIDNYYYFQQIFNNKGEWSEQVKSGKLRQLILSQSIFWDNDDDAQK